MSITVTIYYTGKDDNAKKFAEEMLSSGLVKKIKEEPGNIGYSYYSSLEDPSTILLLDSWKNQKALDEHHASPMMDEIMRLREKYDLVMKAERYVTDEAGFSSNDKKFISN